MLQFFQQCYDYGERSRGLEDHDGFTFYPDWITDILFTVSTSQGSDSSSKGVVGGLP